MLNVGSDRYATTFSEGIQNVGHKVDICPLYIKVNFVKLFASRHTFASSAL